MWQGKGSGVSSCCNGETNAIKGEPFEIRLNHVQKATVTNYIQLGVQNLASEFEECEGMVSA